MQFHEIFCCSNSCKFSLFNVERPYSLLFCHLILLIRLESVQLESSLYYTIKRHVQKILSKEYAPINYISKGLLVSRALKLLQKTSGCNKLIQIKHVSEKIRFLLDHQPSNTLSGLHFSHMPFSNNLIVIIITIC